MGSGCSLGRRLECDWPGRVRLGERVYMESSIFIKVNHPFDEGPALDVGDDVFIGRGCEFNIAKGIKVGSRTLIASRCVFADVGHRFESRIPIKDQPCTAREISVMDDVWIGSGCVILGGVRVGEGAVIAAGAVVTKDVPAFEVWAGVPARKIKER